MGPDTAATSAHPVMSTANPSDVFRDRPAGVTFGVVAFVGAVRGVGAEAV